MATTLTDEEKEELDVMPDDELRIVMEGAVRKRGKVKEDKAAYVKACNDIIKLQEAKMDYAVKVLGDRYPEPAKPPAPPPTVPGASAKPPPPPPPPH